MSKPVVRFAPSPTGYLHIGGARTALYNWLFARNLGGTFILRIEDTDRERSEKRFEEEILESMAWLGLDWDTELTYQSQRLDLYKEYAQKLLEKGLAYIEKNEEGNEAIILKMPEGEITFKDAVYKTITFDLNLLKDLVIIKSDGMATYNFACVVDDAAMGITHIIRGDDHVSNTPKQLALYDALGFDRPIFAHVPMIIGEDGKRLSKRHGAVAVLQYRQDGFIPEALTNYLALLGWSPGDNREIMSKDEMVQSFGLDRVSKKSALFSLKKLKWMNGQHIRLLPYETFKERAVPFYKDAGIDLTAFQEDKVDAVLKLYHIRTQVYTELPHITKMLFTDSVIEYSEDIRQNFFSDPEIVEKMTIIAEALREMNTFSKEGLEAVFTRLVGELECKAGELIHPLRAIVTGAQQSAGIFEVLEILGKDLVLKRLDDVLSQMK